MAADNAYRAKAWECLSLAECLNDPEERAEIVRFAWKLGLRLESEKTDGERVYRIISGKASADGAGQPSA